MNDPMDAIRQTYFQECEELLSAMEEGLLALEAEDADREAVNAVFRAVHSIKGGAGAFGFKAQVHFSPGLETGLDMFRSGKLEAGHETLRLLLRAGDMLADHVSAARDGTAIVEGTDTEIAAALARLAGKEDAEDRDYAPADFEGLDFTPVAIAADMSAASGWRVRFAPHAALYAHANEPALLIGELARLGDLSVQADLSSVPLLTDLDPAGAYMAWDMTLAGDVPRGAIEDVFDFVTGDCDLVIALRESQETPLPLPNLPPLPQAANHFDHKEARDSVPRPTIRVDLEKVDRLVNLVGEMVIAQAMVSQRVGETPVPDRAQLVAGLDTLEHLLRALQDSVMAIRTQPVKSVFQRMPRLVRELAAQTGKSVRLVVEGETTEVDKTVIERLGEPLTHIIRNAVDHGLEAPQVRAAAGKPQEGTVRLSASHRGGQILIEIADDGQGIDRARVLARAEENGVIAPGTVLSDEETDNLIFLPGFSTAREVSDISGRGVGMDVVRRNITDLGGRVTIASRAGRGSLFSLTLPLTLAVLDGMVVTIAGQTFVLPLSHIVESLKPKPGDIQPLGREVTLLNVRGARVPLVAMAALLGLPGARADVDPVHGVAILVESQGDGRMALLVDTIVGQRQVVIKNMADNYRPVEGIAAATILGDGRVALILDVDAIVACVHTRPNAFQPTGS